MQQQSRCAVHGHDCHQGVFSRNLFVGQRIPLAGVAHHNGTIRFGHDRPRAESGVEDWTRSSDHGPFHDAGIPFVYFGVEDHPDYHRPSDEVASITPGFYVNAVRTIASAIRELDAARRAGLRAVEMVASIRGAVQNPLRRSLISVNPRTVRTAEDLCRWRVARPARARTARTIWRAMLLSGYRIGSPQGSGAGT